MAGKYAKATSVSAERSRAEIETTLKRYGATAFMSGYNSDSAQIMFEAKGRRVRFTLRFPTLSEFDAKRPGRSRRASLQSAYDQEYRRLWRALALYIKAKLEAVESGIATFEEAFMANISLPDGKTVSEWIEPHLKETYLSGRMPPLLPSGKEKE